MDARSTTFFNSFFPKSIREYNQLHYTIRNPNITIKEFKSKIKQQSNIPLWYFTGERKASIVQSRLRMNCSSLKAELYNLNIINDNKCECSESIEDVTHFFFHCPLYITFRQILFQKLNTLNFNITLNNLLFGDTGSPVEINVKANDYIQDYITDSRRFI